MSNPFRTTKIQSYTTQLLADLDKHRELRLLTGFAVSLLTVSALALAWLWKAPAAEPQTARAPIVILTATATPRPAPTATPAPAPVREVEAYDQPDGVLLGRIPLPASFSARYGVDWLQAPWQDGQVWIRASDVGAIPIGLVDLEPQPTAVVVIAERPPRIIYEPVVEPAPIIDQPAPEQPAQPAPAVQATAAPVVAAPAQPTARPNWGGGAGSGWGADGVPNAQP
jgi:hypothetical protein